MDDPVYGAYHIEESVLIDLLGSSALARLRGVHQGGASFMVREKRDVTRYDHSVGVMLLIRRLGGSVREQIAGLLHDISHTAFSHVVDYVFEQREEDFHEQHFTQLLLRSDIPQILACYDLSLEDIFPLEQWPLLEQAMPDLCADRVDYTLRDLLRFGVVDVESVQRFLDGLRVYEGKIVCVSLQEAVWFTQNYARLINEVFLHPLELYAGAQLARAIRIALNDGILREEDLFLQDDDVLRRLQNAHSPAIEQCLATLHPNVEVVEDTNTFDLHVYVKARIVDPLVIRGDGGVVRSSTLEPRLKEIHTAMRQRAEHGAYIKAIIAHT